MKKLLKSGVLSVTAIMLMATATLGQAATFYKWTDPNGTPHYSQNPPTNGVNLKKVQVIELRDGGRVANAGQMAGRTTADPTADANLTPEQKRIKDLEALTKLKCRRARL